MPCCFCQRAANGLRVAVACGDCDRAVCERCVPLHGEGVPDWRCYECALARVR